MSERDDLARVLMLAAAHPKVEIEQPVNLCPDDDPPEGPRPMQKVWATDLTKTVEDVLVWARGVKRIAWHEGATSRQCQCAAYSEGECACACGNYPSEPNPYT